LGPNRKLILQGSSISVPSFIISPQSEIFYHIFWLSRWTMVLDCKCMIFLHSQTRGAWREALTVVLVRTKLGSAALARRLVRRPVF